MYRDLQVAGFKKKPGSYPGRGMGTDAAKPVDDPLATRLSEGSAGLSFRLSGRLALEKLQQRFHLCHYATHLSCLG